MTTPISRRTLAKGAAWTAPAVLATAAVPAYAASATVKEYGFGYQALAEYGFRRSSYSVCNETQATFTTKNVNLLPWSSGHAIAYDPNSGTPATDATLHKYTITVAFPAGTTSNNWVLDNDMWSVEKISVSTLQDKNNRFSVYGMDVYRFTYNGPRTKPATPLNSTVGWPEGIFTATDNTLIQSCNQRSTLTYYIQYDWSFSTANGFSQADTVVTRIDRRSIVQ